MAPTPKFPNQLRKFREQANLSQPELAALAGTNVQNVSRIERGERELSKKWAETFAPHLGVSPERLIFTEEVAPRMAPIVGKAGADPNGSVQFAEGQGDYGEVPAPPGAAATTAAIEVTGDSMRQWVEDGDIIFYEERTEPNESYLGKRCVCWLEDGRVLIKTPQEALYPGLYNLESFNAATMRGIAVRYMAVITGTLTREGARRLMRREPGYPVTDIPNGRSAIPRSR